MLELAWALDCSCDLAFWVLPASSPRPKRLASVRIKFCSMSGLVKQWVQVAVLGVKHFRPNVNLQRDADVALGHDGGKKCLHHRQQSLARTLLRGLGAATAHAQVQVDKGVVTGIGAGIVAGVCAGDCAGNGSRRSPPRRPATGATPPGYRW